MKILFIILISFLVTSVNLSSQPSLIKIHEGSSFDNCGYVMTFEKIYESVGDVKVDIYFSKGGTGKPFSGGYGRGDTLDVGDSCKWILYAIDKPISDVKGDIYLSKYRPGLSPFHGDSNYFYCYRFAEYFIQNESWLFKDVGVNSEGKMYFTVSKRKTFILDSTEENKETIVTYTEGQKLFLGGGKYKFVNILNEVESNVKGITYLTPAAVMFSEVPKEKQVLTIRKMKYSEKMNTSEEEWKKIKPRIYLLKLIFTPIDYASPMIEIEREGKKMLVPYIVMQTFSGEEEAREYAERNNITDINFEYK